VFLQIGLFDCVNELCEDMEIHEYDKQYYILNIQETETEQMWDSQTEHDNVNNIHWTMIWIDDLTHILKILLNLWIIINSHYNFGILDWY